MTLISYEDSYNYTGNMKNILGAFNDYTGDTYDSHGSKTEFNGSSNDILWPW